jgi:MerR family transcriptional regulator, repressor of the yfmOP operon
MPVAADGLVLRIGELAREAGTTPRTVRYYEEIGLLADPDERSAGVHRTYMATDVERLRELLRLKGLLGLSLDELRDVMRGEDAREQRRRAFQEATDPTERRRILLQAAGHTDSLLAIVRRRKAELEAFEAELNERRAARQLRLAELDEA